MFFNKKRYFFGLLILSGFLFLPTGDAIGGKYRTLKVTATAYNSVPSQTDETPDIAAWGDKLKPGMKAIAVSRDLLKKGLTRGTKVKISGLPGKYTVLDKTHKRWKLRIDIYMGKNVKAAKKWKT